MARSLAAGVVLTAMRVTQVVKGMTTKQGLAIPRSVNVQSGAIGAYVLYLAVAESAIEHANVRTKMTTLSASKFAMNKLVQVDIVVFL